MENALELVSNEHRSIYYSAQLRIIDVSQNIRAMGVKMSQNEIKMATTESYNNSLMLQKIFEQAKIIHIYQLIKNINKNYNSIIAILLQRFHEVSVNNGIQSNEIKNENIIDKKQQQIGETNLLKQIKKNKLRGIQLFNQNYTRYLENQRILQEIKIQKAKRLRRNKLEILRESLFQQLNHKTDVEENTNKNDEIANYILKTKDKNSIFNYVSYEAQLQEIIAFFQNSQTQANQFLTRKVGKINMQQGTFSFADFQRQIQLKNMTFKNQMIQKFRQFLLKYRQKQTQIKGYVQQKQQLFKKLQQKYFKTQQVSIQTQYNLSQNIKNYQYQIKELQLRYNTLENIKKQQMNNNNHDHKFTEIIALQQNQIQKMNYKINQLQCSTQYLRKLLREEKNKKYIHKKQQEIQKQTQNIEKQKIIQPSKDNNQIDPQTSAEILELTSSQQIRKTSYMSNSWRRKASNDATSYLSFNQIEKQGRQHQSFSRFQRKKYVRYHIESKSSETQKNNDKNRHIQFHDFAVQTQRKLQDYISKINKVQSSQKIQINSIRNLDDQKYNKKNKNSPISTPKNSSKNFDKPLSKQNSLKISDNTYKNKQKNNKITSLNRIKTQQQMHSSERYQKYEGGARSKKGAKRIIKQQIKIDHLNFNTSQSNDKSSSIGQEIRGMDGKDSQYIYKNMDRKDQMSYKIFEVREQQGEYEKDTIKNTERSEKISSVYSHKKLQSELIQKLNRQLYKLRQDKTYELLNLYNITILPYRLPDNKIYNNNEQQDGKDKDKLIQLKSLKEKEKDYKKQINIFDNLIKNQNNQFKKQRLKIWKSKLINNLKNQIISIKQADQILSIIHQNHQQNINHQRSSIHQESSTPIASIGLNIRSSLPQIEIQAIQGKKNKKCLRKSKLKTSCEQNNQSQKLQKKISLSAEQQKNISDLIKYQSLKDNFKSNFIYIHKKCQEGPICSHINKYFQTILKYYQEKKKKSKQPITLPIEHIGTVNSVDQEASSHQKYCEEELDENSNIKKEYSKSKFNVGSKHRYSQQFILPNIKDTKIALSTNKNSKFAI